MQGLNHEALAQLEHMQQQSCFGCAQEAGIHYSSLAASLNCVSPLTFHTHTTSFASFFFLCANNREDQHFIFS